MEFMLAGLAAMGAGFFTNPLEVIKTRLQLQGELKARGLYTVHYKNFFHAFYTVAKVDGVLALQKGLVPGLWFQLCLNGVRLGAYQYVERRGWTLDKNGNISVTKSAVAGIVAGCAGAFTGSPFYLVKTQLQSQAAEAIAVGYQHHHKGTFSALREIYTHHGITGLWRGTVGALPRVGVGSCMQFVSFSKSKEFLVKREYFVDYPLVNTFMASMLAGIAVTLSNTPFDVVMTRLYNQGVDSEGKGILYRSYLDCLVKTAKAEGIRGLYKGLVPSYARMGPHTVLCFVFLDALRQVEQKLNKRTKKLKT